LFIFIIPLEINSIKKVEMLFKLFLAGTVVLSIALFFAMFTGVSYPRGFGSFDYYYIALSFMMLLAVLYSGYVKNTIKYEPILALFAGALVVSQVRAVWMGLLLSIFFLFFMTVCSPIARNISMRLIKRAIVFAIVSGALVAIVSPTLFFAVKEEVLSTAFASSESTASENNARWRLYVWKDIINETLQKPLLGWGFGKYFVPPTIKELGWGGSWREPQDGDPDAKGFQDPHNSFLSIFHSTGLIGLILIVTLILKFVFTAANSLVNIRDDKIKVYTLGLLMCIVCILGTSFFMVVLEGPYLGTFLWICMGMIISLNRIYYKGIAAKK
jgi:O-antigen ligase